MTESDRAQARLSFEMQTQPPLPPPHTSMNNHPSALPPPPNHPHPAHQNIALSDRTQHVGHQGQHLPPPPPRNSVPEANHSYQTQEIKPTDNYQGVPGGYPEHDDLAYGNDPRGKRDKIRKEPREPTLKDLGSAIFGGKHRKRNEMGDPRMEQSPRPRGSQSTESRLRGERDQLKAERDSLRGEYTKLFPRCAQLEDENRRLKADLEQERIRVERTMRSANQMQSTMDNRESFLGPQTSDDEICNTFRTLMTDIRAWSMSFSNPVAHCMREDAFPAYQRVTPMYTSFKDLEKTTAEWKQKRFFVRGWTAYIMCTKLFRSLDPPEGQDTWLNKEVGFYFGFLESRLWLADRKAVSNKSFNDWRAFTAELLGKAVPVHNAKSSDQTPTPVDKAVADVMDVVKAWHKTGTPAGIKAEAEKLHAIFTNAVHFAQLLRRQRALWSIRFTLPSSGETNAPLKFNPCCMEDERNNDDVDMEELKKRCVEFIVTPALYKRGTMNGEFFDREDAACRAAVVIDGLN